MGAKAVGNIVHTVPESCTAAPVVRANDDPEPGSPAIVPTVIGAVHAEDSVARVTTEVVTAAPASSRKTTAARPLAFVARAVR